MMFHVALVAGLLLLPHSASEERARDKPIYNQLIKPAERKIIWYRASEALPELPARQRIGTFPTPRAAEKSKVTIIATAPKPKSVKQFIWQPVPQVEIRQDVPTPNLIARAAPAIPVPPPPPEPKPKVERPEKAQQAAVQPIEIPRPRKTFVPPPPTERPLRVVIPVQTADVPVPDANITGAPAARAALPDGFSKGAPPPPNAVAGNTNGTGKGKVEVAVVGLNPSEAGAIPDGSRPGQFSKAPTVGGLATGEVKGGNGVPDLTIQDDHRKPVAPPHVDAPGKIVLYSDRLRSLPVTTLSVPLRPASRTIPASIEARFRGRNVFSMVIPIENIDNYSGDWIIWFAERQPKTGDVPLVRAPVPLRKFESVDPVPPGARTELRVQLAAIITRQGKLEVVALLKDLPPALETAVLRDVQSWEFKPATRDGAPVDIDIVIEIPFSLPPRIARISTP